MNEDRQDDNQEEEVKTNTSLEYDDDDYFESDKEIVKTLIDINRQRKELDRLEMKALSLMGNQEERIEERINMHRIVGDLHGKVLQGSLSDTKKESLEPHLEPEDMELVSAKLNKKFYGSSEIFNKHSDDKNQKALVKSKHLGLRMIKKAKTANQHLNTVIKAKQAFDAEKAYKELKERLDAQEQRLNKIETKQIVQGALLLNISEDLKLNLPQEIISMLCLHVDERKVLMYNLDQSNPHLKQKDLAEIFKVTTRTIKSWNKEVKQVVLSNLDQS